MKKTMLLLFGLFTLVACSEDVVPETTDVKQDEGIAPPTSDPAIPYDSPYDTNVAGVGTGYGVAYSIHNNTGFGITIAPYFGLAYYDGADDGWYNHPTLPAPIDLSNGSYPNLYSNNGTEYINLIRGAEIDILGWTQLDEPPLVHCPTLYPNDVYFDVLGGGGTNEEADLLQEFGKIYYFDLNILTPGGVLLSDRIRLEFNHPSPSSPWYSWGVTSMFSDEIFVHSGTDEIILADNNTPSEINFTYMGTPYTVQLISDLNSVMLILN